MIVSTEVAYLIIFCISGSIVLIIPNCYPFNIKLKEDIQFKEEDVIRWWGKKFKFVLKAKIFLFFFAKHRK